MIRLRNLIGASMGAALIFSAPGAPAAPAPAATPIAGVKMTVLAIPSDPPGEIRQAPGGGRVLTPVVLYTPATGENVHSPAIVIVDRGPGSNPGNADEPARWAAERFAARGYTVLSVQSHMDRGYTYFPFSESATEIDAALSVLETRGYEDFVLAGSSYGAIAAANYLAERKDTLLDNGGERRVKAVVMLDPITELRHYPGIALAKNYDAVIAGATTAFATGRNGYPADHSAEIGGAQRQNSDDRIGTGNFVAPAEAVLDFWSPQAAERNARLLGSLPVETLFQVSSTEPMTSPDKVAAFAAKAGARDQIKRYPVKLAAQKDVVVADAAAWLAQHGLAPRPQVHEQIVDTVAADGTVLSAMLYTPDKIDPAKPALLMIHGRAGDMIESSTHWMGWRAAQMGYVVLAPSLRISGLDGIQSSTRAEVTQDITKWMSRFAELGYKRVIATGHSNGGIWISDYTAVTHDPRIVGLIYMAPTVNVESWAERRANPETYAKYKAAKAAVESGRGTSKTFGIQSAILVYDSLRPENPSHPERMSQFNLPALAIIGSEDDLFKRPGVRDRLRNAYKGPYEEIVYEGGSHGLRENKERWAKDVDRWIHQTFP